MLEDAMNHRVFPLNESDRIFKLANSRPLALLLRCLLAVYPLICLSLVFLKGFEATLYYSCIRDNIIDIELHGNPYKPVMDPVSYEFNGFRGMHGGITAILSSFDKNIIEPAYRAEDLKLRRQLAIEFTGARFKMMFPAWLAKCKCYYKE